MTHDRFFDQIANPNYKEQFEQKLSDIYEIGKKLAKEYSDEVLFSDDPGGPTGDRLTFHQEALIEAGFPDDFLSGELTFFDEYEEDGARILSGTSLALHRSHEVENIVKFEIEAGEQVTTPTGQTNTVIISSGFNIYDPESASPEMAILTNNDRWPLETWESFVDLEGNNVLPIFDSPETPLAASKHEHLDLHGGDMLIKLMEIETRLRQAEA